MSKREYRICNICGKEYWYSYLSWNFNICKPCKKEKDIKEINEYNKTIFKEFNTKHNNITIYKNGNIIISDKNDYWNSIQLSIKEFNKLNKKYKKLKVVKTNV